MPHATELAAAKLEFARFVGIELKSPWHLGLELNTAIFHRFDFKPVLLVGSFQMHAQQRIYGNFNLCGRKLIFFGADFNFLYGRSCRSGIPDSAGICSLNGTKDGSNAAGKDALLRAANASAVSEAASPSGGVSAACVNVNNP